MYTTRVWLIDREVHNCKFQKLVKKHFFLETYTCAKFQVKDISVCFRLLTSRVECLQRGNCLFVSQPMNLESSHFCGRTSGGPRLFSPSCNYHSVGGVCRNQNLASVFVSGVTLSHQLSQPNRTDRECGQSLILPSDKRAALMCVYLPSPYRVHVFFALFSFPSMPNLPPCYQAILCVFCSNEYTGPITDFCQLRPCHVRP